MPESFGGLTLGDMGAYTKAYAYGVRNLQVIDHTVPKVSRLLKFFQGADFNLDDDKIEWFAREGNPGIVNVPMDATVPSTKGEYAHGEVKIPWDMYWFNYNEGVKEKAIEQIMQNEAQDSVQFYKNVTDWKIIKELKVKAGDSFPAQSGVWDSAADAEQDIIKGLQDIAYNTGIAVSEAPAVLLIYPSKAFTSVTGLDFIHNINQSLKKYLGESYPNLNFIDFTPSLDAGGKRTIDMRGTSSDALGNDALLVYGTPRVLKVGEFVPKKISRVETAGQGVFKGYLTATRRCMGALAVGRFGEITNPAIIKITGVAE